MSQARALYHVQEIELAVIERRKRIKEIDTQLNDNEVVQQAQAELDDAQSKLDTILKKVKDLEQQIETVATKQKSTESRLYSGNVKNPKELQDMQAEIESLTRRRSDLDDQLLEAMVERDEASGYVDLNNEELEQITTTWEAEHTDLVAEKDKLTSESDKMMTERQQVLKRVQPDALKEYNSLRGSKANRPVAAVAEKSCSVCGIEQNGAIISAVNKDDSLVKCQNCGRILVRV